LAGQRVAAGLVLMSQLLRAMSGLLLWGAAFAGLYALEGLGCARAWDGMAAPDWMPVWAGQNLLRALLVIGWAVLLVAHVMVLVVLWLTPARHETLFWCNLERSIAVAGLIATAWTLSPVVALSLCDA